jgi:hypothetical protein
MFWQSYGPKPHAAPAANRNFFHEIKPAVMIPAVTTTRSGPQFKITRSKFSGNHMVPILTPLQLPTEISSMKLSLQS